MAAKLEEREYIRMFELPAIYDGKRSFYGKAKVVRTLNDVRLYSYNTLVASYDADKKTFWIIEESWARTRTTNRHICEFQKQIENGDL